MKIKYFIIVFFLLLTSESIFAQNQDTVNVLRRSVDTTGGVQAVLEDSTTGERKFLGGIFSRNDSTGKERDTFFLKKKEFTPRGATLRSLILPGWGQVYNKQYWKLPIVAAGIGVPVGIFVFNNVWYNRSKDAVDMAFRIQQNPADTVLINSLHKDFVSLYNNRRNFPNGLESFKLTAIQSRNYYRRNQDYAILWTLAMWGLNVADATVFAHLKGFDVSDDISLKVRPVYFNMSNTPGVKLVFYKK